MQQLLEELKRRHQLALASAYPPSVAVNEFANNFINWLFPEYMGKVMPDMVLVEEYAHMLQIELQHLLEPIQKQLPSNAGLLSKEFMSHAPAIYDALTKDADALLQGDPAATCLYEVIRTYPGFAAIAFYRVAHTLHQLNIPLLPRIITEQAHSRTGIDIHPAAVIAPWFCMDHGTGIVIGETSVIGSHVKIYQGVTLGALSVDKDMARSKRHPTIEDHVIIYAGATILGGDTVVGHHSIIGGNVWLIKSTAPHSRVYYKADGSMNFIENSY